MNQEQYDSMNIVIAGHVDHGKSTVIGRLLADTGSLPQGKLEQVRKLCEATARRFEYAFLLDALKDEQAQGITIDSARVFFKTEKRRYIIIDAPGHIEFLKNMISGAARAEAALLVVDAQEGLKENSRRHAYLLSMLGLRQVAVVINKMDLCEYRESSFYSLVEEFSPYLRQVGLEVAAYIPVAAVKGENIFARSDSMSWYSGPTVLEMLDQFQAEESLNQKPFRMPVQDVYKFTQSTDDRRIVAGTVSCGRLQAGDELVFLPSGKSSRVKKIECFSAEGSEKSSAEAGEAIGFTLEEQIYVTRGEVACKKSERTAHQGQHLHTSLFWLGRQPLSKDKEYILKLGTMRVAARLVSVDRLMDSSSLEVKGASMSVHRHEVAECKFFVNRPLAFDFTDEIAETSRFVLVDGFEISGGGIIKANGDEAVADTGDSCALRLSAIEESVRAERYRQKPMLLVLAGEEGPVLRELAVAVERHLFDRGHSCFCLDSVSGLGLEETAGALVKAGAIVIVTSEQWQKRSLQWTGAVIPSDQIRTVAISPSFELQADFQVCAGEILDKVQKILEICIAQKLISE